MPKAYYESKDKTSRKFWEIETKGKTVTVRFGKVGTDGQTKVKTFESSKDSTAHAAKVIAEKVKKGYRKQASLPRQKSPRKQAVKMHGQSQDIVVPSNQKLDEQDVLWRIRPRQKKSIWPEMEFAREVEGVKKSFVAEEHYRFGVGYVPCGERPPAVESETLRCDPDLALGNPTRQGIGPADADEVVMRTFVPGQGKWSDDELEELERRSNDYMDLYGFADDEDEPWEIVRADVVIAGPFSVERVAKDSYEPVD